MCSHSLAKHKYGLRDIWIPRQMFKCATEHIQRETECRQACNISLLLGRQMGQETWGLSGYSDDTGSAECHFYANNLSGGCEDEKQPLQTCRKLRAGLCCWEKTSYRPISHHGVCVNTIKCVRRELAMEFRTVPPSLAACCQARVCVYVEILWWCFLSKTNGSCFAVTRSSITMKPPSVLRWCQTSGGWIVQADNWMEAAPDPDQVISTQHSSLRVLHPPCSAFLLLFCSICCCLTEFCKPTTSVTSTCGLCLYHPRRGLATSFAVISIWQIIYFITKYIRVDKEGINLGRALTSDLCFRVSVLKGYISAL